MMIIQHKRVTNDEFLYAIKMTEHSLSLKGR